MQQNCGGVVRRDDLHLPASIVANHSYRYPNDVGHPFIGSFGLCSGPNQVRTNGDNVSENQGTLLCAGLAIIVRGNMESNEDPCFWLWGSANFTACTYRASGFCFIHLVAASCINGGSLDKSLFFLANILIMFSLAPGIFLVLFYAAAMRSGRWYPHRAGPFVTKVSRKMDNKLLWILSKK